MLSLQDTIVAIATPNGIGALGMIRVSGPQALALVNAHFSKDITQAPGYSLHYGKFLKAGELLDEVVLSVFRAPHSFSKEDTVEISFHGSPYILREALQELVNSGCRLAEPGEFTQRAYLNGAMDLAQAEAVADLIASHSQQSHRLAMKQLRGGVSHELGALREQLLNFTSLIELELDFSEEDVEFADRSQLSALLTEMDQKLRALIDSFQLGNALKQGVATVIVGKPNAGKSTLLNALLNDNRAIVSAIPGTTRDVIEDRVVIEGIEFRLIDTAGVRETQDVIEAEGVSRTLAAVQKAQLVIYLFDLLEETMAEATAYVADLDLPESTQFLIVGNKADLLPPLEGNSMGIGMGGPSLGTGMGIGPMITNQLNISAQSGEGLAELRQRMVDAVHLLSSVSPDQTLISNVRHLNALQQAYASLKEVQQGLESGLTGDLLTIDIRRVLHFIGEITGEITTDEVLGNIFGKFCIGK